MSCAFALNTTFLPAKPQTHHTRARARTRARLPRVACHTYPWHEADGCNVCLRLCSGFHPHWSVVPTCCCSSARRSHCHLPSKALTLGVTAWHALWRWRESGFFARWRGERASVFRPPHSLIPFLAPCGLTAMRRPFHSRAMGTWTLPCAPKAPQTGKWRASSRTCCSGGPLSLASTPLPHTQVSLLPACVLCTTKQDWVVLLHREKKKRHLTSIAFFFLFLTLWLVFGAGEHLGCCLSAACLVQNSSGGSTGSPVCTRYHGHSFHRATMTTGPVKRRPLCVCACVCVFVSVSVSVSGGTTVCPQPAPCLRSPGCRTTTTSTGGGLCLQRHRRRSPRPFRASAGLSSTAHSTGGDLGTPSAIVFLSVNVCVCVANVAFCQLIFGMLVCLSLSLSLLLPALLPCTEPNGCFPTDHSPLFALSLPHQLLQLVHPRCGPRC